MAGEYAGPEQRDAEDETAGQPGEALDLDDRLQRADVALDRAVGRRGGNVVDVAAVGVGERGEDVAGDQGGARDEQVAGPEDEGTRPSNTPICFTWRRYMPVMPASARAAISTFRELRTTRSVVVTGDVGVGMVDLDADEDQSGYDGSYACRPEEVVGVVVVFASCRAFPWRSPRGMSAT